MPKVGRVPHSSAAGDGLTVEVAQLLTIDAAGTATVRGTVVVVRAATMSPPPSPVLAVVVLMPDLRVRNVVGLAD